MDEETTAYEMPEETREEIIDKIEELLKYQKKDMKDLLEMIVIS